MDYVKVVESSLNINLGVFKEPRGIMRVLQLVFAILAFTSTTGFTSYVDVTYCGFQTAHFAYSYPFMLSLVEVPVHCNTSSVTRLRLVGDFSQDSKLFVITGVLSVIYCVAIIFVYIKFSSMYERNGKLPLADFICTVVLGVLWVSESAAWTNAIHALKNSTNPDLFVKIHDCLPNALNCTTAKSGPYFGLNVSIILGFLNFFLWACNLWFLYKETPWFQNEHQGIPNSFA